MKLKRKIIDMDYRNQTAKTRGIFAEPHWPKNDETLLSDYNRLDTGVRYARNMVTQDGYIPTNDPTDSLIQQNYSGRRCR